MATQHAWLFAFTLTLLSELLVAVPLLAPGGTLGRRIAAVSLAQLATHPSVWFIWPLFGWPRPLYLACAEGFALCIEAIIYRLIFERLPWSRALAASALANGASVLVGLSLR
ncbi:MAG: hypothetical protein ABW061_02170 [Polyangiaceae bacterium]